MNLLLLSLGNSAVSAFLRESTGKPIANVRLGYVCDASVGMPFAEIERAGIAALGCALVPIALRDTAPDACAALLETLDAVYVASGETFVLLEAMHQSQSATLFVDSVRGGLPYIGCSAGSIIAGPSVTPAELMDDRGSAPELTDDTGLGLIEQVIVPHADGKLPPYPPHLIEQILTRYGATYPLLPLRDDQALLVTAGGSQVIESL